MSVYTAGSDTDAYCNKCKLVLAHVIIAVTKTRPARVECKTCRAVHAYKASAPASRGSRRGESAGKRNAYDELLAGRDASRALKYSQSTCFTEQQVLDHKSFGLGVVVRALSDKKIEVLFREGTKVLVHDR